MSGGFFHRRRTTGAMTTETARSNNGSEAFSELPTANLESNPPTSPGRSTLRGRLASVSSAAALSSSYGLPSRSYVHHAGHYGSQDSVQYSSGGVREQTAELSSSFIQSSTVERRRRADSNLSAVPGASTLLHQPIAETPEVENATSSDVDVDASRLSAALHRHQQRQSAPSSSAGRGSTGDADHTEPDLPDVGLGSNNGEDMHEETPLLRDERLPSYLEQRYDAESNIDPDPRYGPGTWNRIGHHYPSLRKVPSKIHNIITNPKSIDFRRLGHTIFVKPALTLPAVFLGLLLNLLDALSYGIILFPLGEEVFKDLGPDGVSMFFVSCIISQLVYSTGSIFRGGVGSEMIEVVPFFHKMTYLIIDRMGTGNPAALRSTVIVSYAMSSIITGLVFFTLGAARLGTLVNFFPHSILTGCIGGVGIFLFITGIEVSARLDGNLEFSIDIFKQLFQADTAVLWIPPLVLAVLLLTIKHFFDRPWLVPAYYIGITVIFYIITTAVPSITMEELRAGGWVFEAPGNVPFYNFYSHYNFRLVDWGAIWMTVPSQLALTLFGILHVPINIPNLAMVVQEDNVSINRELIMHGISNTLSGAVGSIQNYLVFVNSVLFINTGGNSRMAGYMLAAATFGLWVAGPVVIGYVPVMVVGTLIYMLGIDLAQEALVATYGRLQRLEYVTIVIIALVMGVYDFVVGIAIGVGLACLVYVVQTSRKTVIRAEFSGAVAESTVRRHPRHRNYLHKVGPQIRIVKLGGYLFFGSIVKVEKKVRAMVDAEAFAASPIRYLVVELTHVTGIDFSAAEAFARMNRILHRREVKMAIAGVTVGGEVGKNLTMVGLFAESSGDPSVPAPKLYEDLNGALEACENELLMVLTEKQRGALNSEAESPPIPIPETGTEYSSPPFDAWIGTPRHTQLHQAATSIIYDSPPETRKWETLKQPLPLLLQAFQDLTDKDEAFWFRATPYFSKREFIKGQRLYARGDAPDGFYLLQSGILRAEYFLEQGAYHESIVAGTTCGELPFFSETQRTSSVVAERDCVAWLLTPGKWEELQERDGQVAKELLKIGMKLSAERMNAITSYVLITAS